MVEQANVPEGEMRIRVLEIGCGVRPANELDGKLFDNPKVQYVGIDLPPTGIWGLREPQPGLLNANCAHLPFPDNTYDYVMMRSMFGQFTLDDDMPSDIEDIRLWGLYESFRVLKPGGKVIVSEENTPWYIRYVESYLKEAGFRVTDFAQLTQEYDQTSKDDKYRRLRSVYFNNRPSMAGPTSWGYPYVMLAEKPTQPKYETVNATVIKGVRDTIFTTYKDKDFWEKNNTEVIATIIYKKGAENTDPDITPRRILRAMRF